MLSADEFALMRDALQGDGDEGVNKCARDPIHAQLASGAPLEIFRMSLQMRASASSARRGAAPSEKAASSSSSSSDEFCGRHTWARYTSRLERDLAAVDEAAQTARRARAIRVARLAQLTRRFEQNVKSGLGTLSESRAAFDHRALHKSSDFDALALRFLLRCVGEIEKSSVREERLAVAERVRDAERRRLLRCGRDWRAFLAHLAEDLHDSAGIGVENVDAVTSEAEFKRLAPWCELQARAIGSAGDRPMPKHAQLRVVDIARITLPSRSPRASSTRAGAKQSRAAAVAKPAVCLDRPALRAALHQLRQCVPLKSLAAAGGGAGGGSSSAKTAAGKLKTRAGAGAASSPQRSSAASGTLPSVPAWQPLREVPSVRPAALRLFSPLVPLSAAPLAWVAALHAKSGHAEEPSSSSSSSSSTEAPPPHNPDTLLPHVYYCVEQLIGGEMDDSSISEDGGVAVSVLQALRGALGVAQSDAAPRGPPPRSVLLAPQPSFTVVGGTGAHRAVFRRQEGDRSVPKQDDVGAGMPDVLRATHAVGGYDERRTDAHFAPATVHQLLATVHCVDILERVASIAGSEGDGGERREQREGGPSMPGDLRRLCDHYWSGRAPPPASLPTLFVASKATSKASDEEITLIPLSDVAIRELIRLYLLPGPWVAAAHARGDAERGGGGGGASTKKTKKRRDRIGVAFPDAVSKMKGPMAGEKVALASTVYFIADDPPPQLAGEERRGSAPPSAASYLLFTITEGGGVGSSTASFASIVVDDDASGGKAPLCARRECLNAAWNVHETNAAGTAVLCELCQAMERSGLGPARRGQRATSRRGGSSLETLVASRDDVMKAVDSGFVEPLVLKAVNRTVGRIKERAAAEKRRKRRNTGRALTNERTTGGFHLLGADSFASPAAPLGLSHTRWTPKGGALFEATPRHKASAAAARRLEAASSSSFSPTRMSSASLLELPPLWLHAEHAMQWDGAALEQTRSALDSESSLLLQIETAERGVTTQLRWLCDHGVYPAEELALIRREFRVIATDLSRRKGPSTPSSRLRGVSSGGNGGSGSAAASSSPRGEKDAAKSAAANDNVVDDAERERKAAIRAELQFCKRKLTIIRACRDEHETAILAAEAELAEMAKQLAAARKHNGEELGDFAGGRRGGRKGATSVQQRSANPYTR